MKILFQALHRPERSPSQRYRFDQFLPYLKEQGYDVEYSGVITETDDAYFYAPGQYLRKAGILLRATRKRFGELRKAENYDLIFVQREAFMLGTPYFELKMAAKRPLIFDFDDAIWQQVVSEGNKRLSFLKNADKTKTIIAAAAEIWAGNQYLADYAAQYNDNVRIVPTVVDTQEYQNQSDFDPQKQQICIGWSGSFSTVPHFEHIAPALEQIKAKYGDKIRFKLIGDANYRNPKLDLQGTPWARHTEIAELSSIDIGLMPLPDDEWTKGKCGLKALVYMSMQIPTIVSPVGVNSDIVTDQKDGLWASSTQEWVEKISLLIENPDLRRRLGQAGRQTVQARYSVEAWRTKYTDYFQQLSKK